MSESVVSSVSLGIAILSLGFALWVYHSSSKQLRIEAHNLRRLNAFMIRAIAKIDAVEVVETRGGTMFGYRINDDYGTQTLWAGDVGGDFELEIKRSKAQSGLPPD